jgi:hypothetical protein
MRYDASDEGQQASSARYDRYDVVGRRFSPPPAQASRTPRISLMLLIQGYGGEVGGDAFVAPSLSPDPLRSRLSARVSRSPHAQPKEVPREHHSETGPSSTTLSPHSSHTRTPLLEGPFTGQLPPYRASAREPRAPEGSPQRQGPRSWSAPSHSSERTCRPRSYTRSSDLDLHVNLS